MLYVVFRDLNSRGPVTSWGKYVYMKPQYENWRFRYQTMLGWVDAVAIIWAVAGAYIVRFHSDIAVVPSSDAKTYAALSIGLSLIWWLLLRIIGTRDVRILGSGLEEYKGVFSGSLSLFGALAIISYALKFETARGYVGLALPAGLLALLVGRWTVRQLIQVDRSRGRSLSRVLVIGGPHAADHLIRSLLRQPAAGYIPVGAYLPGFPDGTLTPEVAVPVVGHEPSTKDIIESIENSRADAVAISAGANLRPSQLRKLGWDLASRGVGMILAPALTGIAGPRIHTQQVAGLPLVHVSTPKLTGGKRVAKRVFDIAVSAALLVALSPLLIVLSFVVKVTSPGPIFYKQARIGVHGSTFHMIKFRSMRVNADSELEALLLSQGSGDQPLFKVQNDPRLTRVGALLRQYSLDELPQLINVLTGSMSLVGPRPQRQAEVALYDDAARRRLYVSPGMSGLWQVSGRSNLTWEESIQLDLYYVENWSLTQDIMILLKTFRAVFARDGAI